MQLKLDVVADPDEVFFDLLKKDPAHPDQKDERIPYWPEVWPSAIALSRHLCLRKKLLKDVSTIEVGCGLALPSIVAAKYGARVTLSDYLPMALDYAVHNWNLNLSVNPVVKVIDLRLYNDSQQYDLVLASDIAYESKNFDSIGSGLLRMLAPNGTILISEPDRFISKKFFSEYLPSAFSIQKHPCTIDHKTVLTKVTVYELKRK